MGSRPFDSIIDLAQFEDLGILAVVEVKQTSIGQANDGGGSCAVVHEVALDREALVHNRRVWDLLYNVTKDDG